MGEDSGDQEIKLNQVEVNLGASVDIAKNFQYAANWIVICGVVQFLVNSQQINLSVNESRYIPIGSLARLTNIGDSALVIITVQLDDYLSKNDIMTLAEIDKASVHG